MWKLSGFSRDLAWVTSLYRHASDKKCSSALLLKIWRDMYVLYWNISSDELCNSVNNMI
jgi:hypothetical protein